MSRNVITGDDRPREVREILFVAPSVLEIDPAVSAREVVDENAIARMVVSLRRFGQLEPVRARKVPDGDGQQRLRLIFGNNRTRAGRIIEETDPNFRLHVHVVNANEEEAFVMAVEENRQRNRPNAIDDAVNARRFINSYGWDRKRVAELYDVSVQAVDNMLALLSLPGPIRDRVRDGLLPASAALQHLVGLDDAEAIAVVQTAEAAILDVNPVHDDSAPSATIRDLPGQATIPFDDSIPPASEHEPVPDDPNDLDALDSEPVSAATESVPPTPTSEKRSPRGPRTTKGGKPRVTGAQLAAARRTRGKSAKRTWSDVRAVLESCDDIVSKAVMEFYRDNIDEKELRRVLNEAADAMEVFDPEAFKKRPKTHKSTSVTTTAATT